MKAKKPEIIYFTCWVSNYQEGPSFSNILMSRHPLAELAYRERSLIISKLVSWRELTPEEWKIYQEAR